jgi:hypothetical protein
VQLDIKKKALVFSQLGYNPQKNILVYLTTEGVLFADFVGQKKPVVMRG